jgi:circadian clock protein KaiC
LAKCPTGIHGLDVITGGGLPRGRPTLICGAPGSGKTLFGMESAASGSTASTASSSASRNARRRERRLARPDGTDRRQEARVDRSRSIAADRGDRQYDLDGLFIRLMRN